MNSGYYWKNGELWHFIGNAPFMTKTFVLQSSQTKNEWQQLTMPDIESGMPTSLLRMPGLYFVRNGYARSWQWIVSLNGEYPAFTFDLVCTLRKGKHTLQLRTNPEVYLFAKMEQPA